MTNKLFCCWFGGLNKMSFNRKSCLESIFHHNKNVILITEKNLNEWIKEPHPSFSFLSETHKSDYVRTYLARFYGGGYTDIKRHHFNWDKHFEELNNEENTWMIGSTEANPWDTAVLDLQPHYKSLLSMCSYIIRPNTSLTIEWYDGMIKKLDEKYTHLTLNPSKHPQDKAESGFGYPLRWAEILGEFFHPACFKYKDHLKHSMPKLDFSNYR